MEDDELSVISDVGEGKLTRNGWKGVFQRLDDTFWLRRHQPSVDTVITINQSLDSFSSDILT